MGQAKAKACIREPGAGNNWMYSFRQSLVMFKKARKDVSSGSLPVIPASV